MINETFVASDPKNAYEQAVKKYGNEVSLVSAKQLKYDDGILRCEVVIAVPKELFMEKSFGDLSMDNSSSDEDETLLEEIGELKAQLLQMKDGLMEVDESLSITEEVKALFVKKGIAERWLDEMFTSLIGTPVVEDAALLVSYLLEEIDDILKVKEEELGTAKVMMLVGPTGVGKTTIALLNLDSYKVGAIEQLEHYADIMQIEHHSVSSVEEFKEKLEQLAD